MSASVASLTTGCPRLFRTGDRVRRLPDGNLQFVGRCDDQIKLHGLRIEPGEIEATLRTHSLVRDAAVKLWDDGDGEARLAAYVVVEQDGKHDRSDVAGLVDEQVAHWQVIFDDTYRQASPDGAEFNRIGWNSSYDGRPIPAEEMQAWLDRTVERIRRLLPTPTARVLEIGCGTGGILFRVAPHCGEYHATDFSAASVGYVERALASLLNAPTNVSLHHQAADDFTNLPEAAFDLIVLNSVVQYFPDVEYVLRVVQGAARALKPDGVLFLGDVRQAGLLEMFAASIELHTAADDCSVDELRHRVERRIESEEELCIAPELFMSLVQALPEWRRAETWLKRSGDRNELTRYRYDAVLYRGATVGDIGGGNHTAYSPTTDVGALLERAARDGSECGTLTSVPNARLAADRRVCEHLFDRSVERTVAELRTIAAESCDGYDPEQFWAWGEAHGFDVVISWSAGRIPGAYDVSWRRRSGAEPTCATSATSAPDTANAAAPHDGDAPQHVDWRQFATSPTQAAARRGLVPDLRRHLQRRLPPGWIPSAFVVLDALPQTVGGKIDRRALPPPAARRIGNAGRYIAPHNDVERRLVEIFEELLDVRPVGIDDSFFELGGNSLAAVRLAAKIEQDFQRVVPLNALFERATVAYLAEALGRANADAPAEALVPLQLHGARLPLFCIHPAGGTVFCYRELAERLGRDRPVYGVTAQGLHGDLAPHRTFEAMAAFYLRAVRTIQPHGPYHLTGWSLGGNIAFEMARQLSAVGETVGTLVLLDAGAVPSSSRVDERDFLELMLGMFPGDDAPSLEELKSWSDERRLRYFTSRAQSALLVEADDLSGYLERVFAVFQANVQAAVDYRPQRYSGSMTLLKAERQAVERLADETLGWREYVDGTIDVHVIAGDHLGLITEPNVRQAAEHLLQSLGG